MGVAVQGGAISFDDYAGSPTFSLTRDSRTARRIGRVTWTDIDALVLECFPVAPALPGAYPGISFLYCDTVEIRPDNPDNGNEMTCSGSVATYGSNAANVTIGYAALPYDPATKVVKRYTLGGEAMTMPPSGLRWTDRPFEDRLQAEDIAAAKIIPSIEHSLTRHRMTAAQFATLTVAIKANIGKVNRDALNNTIFTAVAAEQLLFVGAEASYVFSTNGAEVWTVELRFSERIVNDVRIPNPNPGPGQPATVISDVGWNHFYRNDDRVWVKLINDDGDPVYPLSDDFMDLFA